MKIILALALLLAPPSHATTAAACTSAPCCVDIATGTNNLGTAYSTSFPQQAIGPISAPNRFKNLSIVNENASSGVCCDASTGTASTAPTAGNGRELCVPLAYGIPWNSVPISASYIYCRCVGTACSANTVHVCIW